MKSCGPFFAHAFFLGFIGLNVAHAQLATEPVGFNKVTCKGGSDTLVTVPFHQKPVFSGKVGPLPVVTEGTAAITPVGSPALPAGYYTSAPHYLRFLDGAMDGAWFEVTANTTTSISIAVGDASLGALSSGARFDVIPHWTLGTLLPGPTQSALHHSAGKLPPGRGSSLMLADVTREGIRLAPDRIYFVTTGGWFEAAGGFPAADDVVVDPGQVLIIRHKSGAADTVFRTTNRVHRYDHSTTLTSGPGGPRDHAVGLMRPVPVQLADLDLDATAFLDSASAALVDRKDEVLVYDNLSAALNKTPSKIYFRVGGQWFEDAGGTHLPAGTASIPPSNALVIRKAATATPRALVWVNSPRY
jgi:uncharacterized protein (TIGR02597 family)